MKRVVAYIDGFNLYHAIDGLHDDRLKWVDLWKLSHSIVRHDNEKLSGVNYFSAYATWMPEKYERHRAYVKANQAMGVRAVLGNFKNKPASCRSCGKQWMQREEKETDVNIALAMVRDTFLDVFDRALLISADTDLSPAIRMIEHHAPHKEVFAVSPPNRHNLSRGLKHKLEITQGRILKCLLPHEVRDMNGKIVATIPDKYK